MKKYTLALLGGCLMMAGMNVPGEAVRDCPTLTAKEIDSIRGSITSLKNEKAGSFKYGGNEYAIGEKSIEALKNVKENTKIENPVRAVTTADEYMELMRCSYKFKNEAAKEAEFYIVADITFE